MSNHPLQQRKILLCYSAASTQTPTTHSYITAFSRYADAQVYYLNVTGCVCPDVNLSQFDAVFLSYCARLCIDNYVSKEFLDKLSRFKGVTAVSIQDEYDSVNKELSALDFVQPDIVFTCIPEGQRQLIYPDSRYPKTEFIQVLTGYYDPASTRSSLTPISCREIDIGYRGREIGIRYGLLAKQKAEIGNAFKKKARDKGYNTDISILESDRIYGDRWFHWLSSCKAVLGSPSGSNIFDFDGSIAEACSQPLGPNKETISKINQLDQQYSMGQISPRVFEAASVGAAQIMYVSPYSGILEPHVHYIPVKTDNSNVDEILELIADHSCLDRVAKAAREHLIDSGDYTYKAFVAKVEAAMFSRPLVTLGDVSPIHLAPNCVDLSKDPKLELPTLQPLTFDAYQLKQLLVVLREERVRRTIYLMSPRIRSALDAVRANPFGLIVLGLIGNLRTKVAAFR
jgi:hypothetical protein